MNEKKAMSTFTTMSVAEASASGYGVPIFKAGEGNGGVNIHELAGICGAGPLTDSASIDVPNNALSTLTTEQSALTLNVNLNEGELPNFAVEITTSAAVTVTVTKTVGSSEPVTLCYADAAGNELESGKFYQLTCVGACWTVAEFVDPAAVVASLQSATPETRGLQLGVAPQEENVGDPLEKPQDAMSEGPAEEPYVITDEANEGGPSEFEDTETAEPSAPDNDNVTETTQQDNGGDLR